MVVVNDNDLAACVFFIIRDDHDPSTIIVWWGPHTTVIVCGAV